MRVLPRLLIPRHPPLALAVVCDQTLIIFFFTFQGAKIAYKFCDEDPLKPLREPCSDRTQRQTVRLGGSRNSAESGEPFRTKFINFQYQVFLGCGANRIRTGDLPVANGTLYQLSYSPA